jgi:hypothetical protein
LMTSKRRIEDAEVADSQESLGEAFSNVRLNASVKMIACLMFIFTDKYGRRFVPYNMAFAYNPNNPLHLTKKATKIEEVKEKAKELGVRYHVVDMLGDTEFDVIDEIGGIDKKSAKFPPAPKSNWLKLTVRRAPKKVKIGVQDARITTRSNSGSK